MKSVIEFLDRIEGSGYGGMADFECARTDARDAAAEIDRLWAVNETLRKLVRRYRDETPLGHQPAHDRPPG